MMDGDIGSYAWFLGVGLGLMALGIAIGAGFVRWRHRRLSVRELADQQERIDEMYHRKGAHSHRQG